MEKPITHKNYLFRFHIFHTKLTVKKSLDKHIQRKIWNVTLFLCAMLLLFFFFTFVFFSVFMYSTRISNSSFFQYFSSITLINDDTFQPLYIYFRYGILTKFNIWREKKICFLRAIYFYVWLEFDMFLYRNCMHDGKNNAIK